MTREQILSEIRRLATENAGSPPGQQKFTAETGVRKSEWYGRYWARWGDALKAAGFEPNQFSSATPDDELLEKLASLVRELGHFPVEGELRMRARSDPQFPDHSTLRARLGGRSARAAKLHEYCIARGMDEVAALCPQAESALIDDADDSGRSNSVTADLGCVYLLKSGRFYKIGRTNSLGRREREFAIQLPEKARTVHSIRTDDPVGIEDYWHRRFAERRKNGEWFDLSRDDVAAFRRRKFM